MSRFSSPDLGHQHSSTSREVDLLGLTIHDISREALLDEIYVMSHSPKWSFIVTPNVNHLVRLSREEDLLKRYCRADLKICDSRILAHIAEIKGLKVEVNPGSDLVRDLLDSNRFAGMHIAVVGPTREEVDRLKARFPGRALIHVPSANPIQEGSADWNDLIDRIETLAAQVVLVGLSFPRQELLCWTLGERGIAQGVGIPCGAAVDFLTGKQGRAPLIAQQLSLEWLYRMLTQPRRLVSRYVTDAFWFARILWRDSILRRDQRG